MLLNSRGSHMPKSSTYKKGQFFILTAFAIVTSFYLVSKSIGPAEFIDISQVPLSEEIFLFNNINEKAIELVAKSNDCKELSWNLEEYKIFVEKFGLEKGIKIDFEYQIVSCPPPTVNFLLNVSSPRVYLNSSFSYP